MVAREREGEDVYNFIGFHLLWVLHRSHCFVMAAVTATEPETEAQPVRVELEDGSTFETFHDASEVVGRWRKVHIQVILDLDALCRAGWDLHTYPRLSQFIPLDALLAVRLFLSENPPRCCDPSLFSRLPRMLEFVRAWGCTRTGWKKEATSLENASVLYTNLPIDPVYLTPRVQAALQEAQRRSVLMLHVDQFVWRHVREQLQNEHLEGVADLLKIQDVHNTLEFLSQRLLTQQGL